MYIGAPQLQLNACFYLPQYSSQERNPEEYVDNDTDVSGRGGVHRFAVRVGPGENVQDHSFSPSLTLVICTGCMRWRGKYHQRMLCTPSEGSCCKINEAVGSSEYIREDISLYTPAALQE